MLQKRTKPVLAAGLWAMLLVGTLQAQDLEDVQLFAPSDLSTYGGGPPPHEGYFFSFEGLRWSISSPERVPIGYPTVRQVFHDAVTPEVQSNSEDTSTLAAEAVGGNRIEFGRVVGRQGWVFSIYQLRDQVQRSQAEDVDVVFNDVPFDANGQLNWHLTGYVPIMLGYNTASLFQDQTTTAFYGVFDLRHLPISFDDLFVENRVETLNTQLMYLYRLGQTDRGGFIEFFAGVRYLELDETFRVDATGRERFNSAATPASVDGIANMRFVFDLGPDGDPTATNWSPIGPGVVLADSTWTAEAENHIIGPQIGGRWFRRLGRLTLSAEGQFLAGLNTHNIRSQGVLGSELAAPPPYAFDVMPPGYPYLPILREPYTFDHRVHLREFSPGGELRVELMFELARSVSVKVGWNGMWLGKIARASAMPDYTISEAGVMGVNTAANDQTVFINGLNVGLSINR